MSTIQAFLFCPEQLFPDDEEMPLGVGPKSWCRLNSWRLDFGERLRHFRFVGLCDDEGAG
jgi:hypothetical protein